MEHDTLCSSPFRRMQPVRSSFRPFFSSFLRYTASTSSIPFRLCVTAGPGWAVELDLAVEFGDDFPAAAPSAWQAEYDACVRRPPPQAPAAHEPRSPLEEFDWNVADPQETHDEQYD